MIEKTWFAKTTFYDELCIYYGVFDDIEIWFVYIFMGFEVFEVIELWTHFYDNDYVINNCCGFPNEHEKFDVLNAHLFNYGLIPYMIC